jgi:hypothetical protein
MTYAKPELNLVGAAKGLVLGDHIDLREFTDPNLVTYRDEE